MPDPYLQAISVRPIRPEERARFDAELDEHHWLGHHLVGETMRHVAVGPDDSWVALLGFGAAALACRPREERIGWSDEVHFRRLRYVGTTSATASCPRPGGTTSPRSCSPGACGASPATSRFGGGIRCCSWRPSSTRPDMPAAAMSPLALGRGETRGFGRPGGATCITGSRSATSPESCAGTRFASSPLHSTIRYSPEEAPR